MEPTSFFCSEKTLADLDWHRLLTALGARCRTDAGKDKALELPFANTQAEVSASLGEVQEALSVLVRGEPLPVDSARNVSMAVTRLRIGASLSGPELRDMCATLGAARILRRYLASRRERLPYLSLSCSTDPGLDNVEEEINSAFDSDGTLSDKASPKLRELRTEHRAARTRMIHRLEDIMSRYSDTLQDNYWTEREGRYVLPVRTDAHERFPGIVHATSASGATLFVEPRVVIPMGNRLKMLEGEVRREEEAIYAKLSGLLIEHLPSVLGAVEALALADLRGASARLAEDLKLTFVELVDEPMMQLRSAKHPILAIDGIDVVASDLNVKGGQAIIISGPNAGGKTVALKTMGLAVLMLRAGLPIPCESESRMGLFDRVISDVGDDQSIEKNLSTFSAHIKNVANILDDACRGSLVLLDEIATGTDPREGEALAAAVLDGLCARGAAVMCTTHYEGLKALALADNRFENASVGFDVESMSPTFRVVYGVPGASSALAVAKRFGIPSPIIDRAQTFLSSGDRDFETMVQKLHAQQHALEMAKAAADQARQDADSRSAELTRELDLLRQQNLKAVHKDVEVLVEAVKRAREDLRSAQARLRIGFRQGDENALRDITRIVDRVASKVAVGGELDMAIQEPLPATTDSPELKKGSRVYVPRLRTEADIVEIMSNGQIRVAAGAIKLTVRSDELRPITTSTTNQSKKGLRVVDSAATTEETPVMTRDNTCDIRGLDVEDALRMTEQFLDRCISESNRIMFVLHGYGSGALRNAIRNALRESKYVGKIRPGSQNDGGDGVTVVWLRLYDSHQGL